MMKSTCNSGVRAEISCKPNSMNSRITTGNFANGRKGSVARVIVYDDPLPIHIHRSESIGEPLIKEGQIVFARYKPA